jgi:hypothetical protein
VGWNGKTAFLVIILLLAPLFFGLYFTILSPPRGRADYDGVDTYVSSTDSNDHSSESFVRISNISTGGNVTFEIAYLGFDYMPAPAGGPFTEIYLNFYCSNVESGGTIRLHAIDPDDPWAKFEPDFTNMTYENRPLYEAIPFLDQGIQTNESYSIMIPFDEYQDWNFLSGFVGIAITAEPGVRLTLDSFESVIESRRPKLVIYFIPGIWIRNPWIYYSHPIFLWMPLLGIFITVIAYQRKARKEGDDNGT